MENKQSHCGIPRKLKQELHSESNLVVATVEVLGVQSNRSAELHLVVHGGLEASADLSVGAHLSTHLGVVSYLRDETDHHVGHSLQVSHLAHGRELGLLVQLVEHGKISALEHVVANARANHILVSARHTEVCDGLGTAGSGELSSHQQAVVLELMTGKKNIQRKPFQQCSAGQ